MAAESYHSETSQMLFLGGLTGLHFSFPFKVLELEPRYLCILAICSASELGPSLWILSVQFPKARYTYGNTISEKLEMKS